MGVPGKVMRLVSETEANELIDHAKRYEQLALVHAGKSRNLGFC
jgi:hypothetical protein